MLKSKSKTKKIKTNKIYILLGIVAVLALVGLYIKSLMASPQVALIAEPSKQMCQTNIVSMSFHDECGTPGTFKRAVYTCSNGSTAEKLAGGTNCISYESVLAEAQRNCGQTCTGSSPVPSCVPNPCPGDGRACKLMALPAGQSYCPITTPTPAPSISPSPTPYPTLAPPSPSLRPSPTPQPSSSTGYWQSKCRVRAYKLKPSDDVTKSPMTYATIDREVDHSSNKVKVGESYAYLLELSTLDAPSSIATISASTNNLYGFDEPFVIKSTSPNCQADSKSKFMSCTGRPGINLPKILNNTPTLLDFGMIVTIQPEIEKLYNTSFTINPYLISSAGNGIGASCTVMMLHESTTSTPTPIPTSGPGCYTEQRFCIQSLVGGKCPAVTICPSATPTPTPKPTPTPVPSPVYSTKPSATPTPATCGTSLNKWQFRESCGTKMYRYINFNCSGTTQGQVFGNPNICKSEAEWVAEARTTCMNTKCATPTPTPVMSIAPKPVPTATPTPPNCLRLFGRNICWPTSRR